MESIRVVPTDEEHVASLHQCLDDVARERRYLALVEAPPFEAVRGFVRALMAGAGVQLIAVDQQDAVVGWCDIVRKSAEGFRHCGQLGMGLLPRVRGRGLGRQLAEAAIEEAWAEKLERIELDVFASNEAAVGLYHGLGFALEGVKRKARRIDGSYDDILMMALLGGGATGARAPSAGRRGADG